MPCAAQASALEIYNEEIRDLLGKGPPAGIAHGSPASPMLIAFSYAHACWALHNTIAYLVWDPQSLWGFRSCIYVEEGLGEWPTHTNYCLEKCIARMPALLVSCAWPRG